MQPSRLFNGPKTTKAITLIQLNCFLLEARHFVVAIAAKTSLDSSFTPTGSKFRTLRHPLSRRKGDNCIICRVLFCRRSSGRLSRPQRGGRCSLLSYALVVCLSKGSPSTWCNRLISYRGSYCFLFILVVNTLVFSRRAIQ